MPEDNMAMPEQDMSMEGGPTEGAMTSNGLPMPEQAPDDGGDENMLEELKAHMDSLPPEEKEFVAAHLTLETARLLGVLTGSPDVAEYFGQLADPNIVLVPVPREKAKQLAQALQQEQAQSQQAPQGPAPQMAMATQ